MDKLTLMTVYVKHWHIKLKYKGKWLAHGPYSLPLEPFSMEWERWVKYCQAAMKPQVPGPALQKPIWYDPTD